MSETIKYLTIEEKDRFLDSIDNKRDYVMFSLMYLYGLRCLEASKLRVDSLVLPDGVIRIEAVKNGVSGMYVLLPRTVKMLEEYIEERELEGDSPLFLSKKGGHLSTTQIRRLFYKYAEEAELRKELSHPHVLRHSIAVHLADNGRAVEEVQMHLRHNCISSTMKYYRITSQRRRILQTSMLNEIIN